MNRVYFLWLFNGFFGFFSVSALAVGTNNNYETQVLSYSNALYDLYNDDRTENVTGKLVEIPEAIKNIVKALAFSVYGTPISIKNTATGSGTSISGFFITKKTFISPLDALPFYSLSKDKRNYYPHLQQHKEITQPEREKLLTISPGKVGDAAFKKAGTISNLTDTHILKYTMNPVYKGGVLTVDETYTWGLVSFEVEGYEGPVVELVNFRETDEMYFLNFVNVTGFKNYAPVAMQVTGIKDDPRFDFLALKPQNSWQRYGESHFDNGVVVNSKGKVVGFLFWELKDYLSLIYLVKVTPKLRESFLEKTVKAREDNKGNRLTASDCQSGFL